MIKQTIDQDIKTAMLSGDKQLTSILRTLKSSILSAEITAGKRDEGLSDGEVIEVLRKEQKKRSEAAELYKKGGNQASADQERLEEQVIQKYLPAPLTDDEINRLIDEAIQEAGIEVSSQTMGKLIGAVKDKTGGAADGGTVARLVKARLT